MAEPPAGGKRRIDTHHHIFPKVYTDILAKHG